MKEIGLLFTPENRALVRAGVKTQTRRLLKFPAPFAPGDTGAACDLMALSGDIKCPYGAPEFEPVRYYLKEPVQVLDIGPGPTKGTIVATVRYVDDGTKRNVQITSADYQKLVARRNWRESSSSMFMLKSFARTWLPGVRTWPERLGDMSEADALAEGCEQFDDVTWRCYSKNCPDHARGYDKRTSGRASYMSLWDSINGKTHPWAADTWVWCVEWEAPAVAMEVAA